MRYRRSSTLVLTVALFLFPAAHLPVSPMAAHAAPFVPQTMTLHAPAVVEYGFGGDLEIPVTISGTPANLFFLVFTNGKAGDIRDVHNGYRGWHYVNRIDTCVYYD